jgi:hypothetical protein
VSLEVINHNNDRHMLIKATRDTTVRLNDSERFYNLHRLNSKLPDSSAIREPGSGVTDRKLVDVTDSEGAAREAGTLNDVGA